ncbi:hypothetical protein XI03_12250 [Bradyrhizobium sp. CCBAU 65884]|nr:hypothetical protein [Bradyrhizobium sp. CCBAU 65884]
MYSARRQFVQALHNAPQLKIIHRYRICFDTFDHQYMGPFVRTKISHDIRRWYAVLMRPREQRIFLMKDLEAIESLIVVVGNPALSRKFQDEWSSSPDPKHKYLKLYAATKPFRAVDAEIGIHRAKLTQRVIKRPYILRWL